MWKQSLLCLVYYRDCTYLILLLISPHPCCCIKHSTVLLQAALLSHFIKEEKSQSVHILRVARFYSELSWDQWITWSIALLRAALCLCCGAARTFVLVWFVIFYTFCFSFCCAIALLCVTRLFILLCTFFVCVCAREFFLSVASDRDGVLVDLFHQVLYVSGISWTYLVRSRLLYFPVSNVAKTHSHLWLRGEMVYIRIVVFVLSCAL